MKTLLPLALVLALTACQTAPVREAPAAAAPAATAAHDNLNAVRWMQTAAEYEAAVRGTYAAALAQLDAAIADPAWNALPDGEAGQGFETLPPAIVVDADETMIDNSPFQARGVRDYGSFVYDRWLAWVNERRALALPGAVEFARQAAAKGVPVFFVTNRDAPQETESTIANLRSAGFPIADDASNVLMRGDPRWSGREKSQRRQWIARSHRVVLMLGDNLGDFMDGVAVSVEARRALVHKYADRWGTRWFMQPNPSYGSWEAALLAACGEAGKADPVACKRGQLRLD
jgi:5'-nucleotidase (lipoprotein e(P4) family)